MLCVAINLMTFKQSKSMTLAVYFFSIQLFESCESGLLPGLIGPSSHNSQNFKRPRWPPRALGQRLTHVNNAEYADCISVLRSCQHLLCRLQPCSDAGCGCGCVHKCCTFCRSQGSYTVWSESVCSRHCQQCKVDDVVFYVLIGSDTILCSVWV